MEEADRIFAAALKIERVKARREEDKANTHKTEANKANAIEQKSNTKRAG